MPQCYDNNFFFTFSLSFSHSFSFGIEIYIYLFCITAGGVSAPHSINSRYNFQMISMIVFLFIKFSMVPDNRTCQQIFPLYYYFRLSFSFSLIRFDIRVYGISLLSLLFKVIYVANMKSLVRNSNRNMFLLSLFIKYVKLIKIFLRVQNIKSKIIIKIKNKTCK